ncbi:MAG TPA: DUF3997 domain-containing protein [Chitinophagaceae bacterium]|nr:DUF3997 domain-containing protein [Chitinophagaceae bacterium]
MKKWIITIAVILFLGILFFIIRRSDDQNLGDNYYYLPEYEAIDVGYPGGAIIYKSTQKYLFSNVKISGNIISVNTNKDYIIALQQKIDSVFDKTSSNITEKDSLKYFIIQKKADLLFGPYSKDEYIKKREELGIPKELQFKIE